VSPNELAKELEKGKFRPVYYFYGDEDFRIKEAEKALVKKFIPAPQRATNYTSLSAAKGKIEDILTELSVVPMLGERQLFTIHEIQALNQKDIERILAMITPHDPNRVVILVSPSSKTPRKTTKLFKFLTSETTPVQFPKLQARSAATKITRFFKDRDIDIDPQTASILVELVGGDMGGLTAELNKLLDYIGDKKKIEPEDIAKVSSDYQGYSIYELANYAAHGEIDKALNLIDYLLKRGERASALLFWMGEHFVGLYLTQNKKSPGGRDQSWKYKGQIGKFDNKHLEQIIKDIAAADTELRSNTRQDRLILEKLIFSISTAPEKKKYA